MIIWNPWHGCHRVSEGCEHCYMYFLDGKRGIDTSRVTRTAAFDLPLRRNRHGDFKLKSGMQLFVGLSTDFFVEEADRWRDEAWGMMRQRPDIAFSLRSCAPGSMFGEEVYRPTFRAHCDTCGSRHVCNACSDCGKCAASEPGL